MKSLKLSLCALIYDCINVHLLLFSQLGFFFSHCILFNSQAVLGNATPWMITQNVNTFPNSNYTHSTPTTKSLKNIKQNQVTQIWKPLLLFICIFLNIVQKCSIEKREVLCNYLTIILKQGNLVKEPLYFSLGDFF